MILPASSSLVFKQLLVVLHPSIPARAVAASAKSLLFRKHAFPRRRDGFTRLFLLLRRPHENTIFAAGYVFIIKLGLVLWNCIFS